MSPAPSPQPGSSCPATIRLATAADLSAVNDIYNHYVLHSTSTYQEEPEPLDGRRAWFGRHGLAHPVTVAERDGVVVGWGSLSPFRERTAYRRTVENAVYVHPAHHRQGLGRAVLLDLIERAKAIDHHTIIAGIDADQAASVGLHRSAGFVPVAHLRQVGFKFGRWLDVIYMQLMI